MVFEIPEEELESTAEESENSPEDIDLLVLAQKIVALLRDEINIENERTGR
jgi:hypothetical protein